MESECRLHFILKTNDNIPMRILDLGQNGSLKFKVFWHPY